MSGVISFNLAWFPVMLFYPFVYIDDINWKQTYLIASMASIDGPMLGNAVPLILALICYFQGFSIQSGWFIPADLTS
jgi:hypothetical protein